MCETHDDARQQIALFRYGLIADRVLHCVFAPQGQR